MAFKLKKTRQFTQDFKQLTKFYAVESQEVGERFVDSVAKTIHLIHTFPLLGSQLRLETAENLRYRGIPRFRPLQVFYVVDGQEITLRRILHGARDLPTLLDK